MQELEAIIRKGWPHNRNGVPEHLKVYCNFRDELSLQDGLIFKGECLVLIVPGGVRDCIKSKVPSSHMGIQGCLESARHWMKI